MRYIERNPVRAKIVKNAWDYPWSSAAYHAGEIETDLLVEDRNLMGLMNDWRSFLADENEQQAEALRLAEVFLLRPIHLPRPQRLA